eukprot:712407-Hanusia_phi.AAC.6
MSHRLRDQVSHAGGSRRGRGRPGLESEPPAGRAVPGPGRAGTFEHMTVTQTLRQGDVMAARRRNKEESRR